MTGGAWSSSGRRSPLDGRQDTPGTVAFVAVMLGSVAFDGFSRTSWWQDRLYNLESRYIVDSPRTADLVATAFNLLGLLAAVGAVALLFLAAVYVARPVSGTRGSLVPLFVGSLVPIALAYSVAHYFTLLVNQGQFAIPLFSDPFGKGWDVFGTDGFQPSLFNSPNAIWYTQVAVLVVGHVLGLALAHDKAVAIWGSAHGGPDAIRDAGADGAVHVYRPMAVLNQLSRSRRHRGPRGRGRHGGLIVAIALAAWVGTRRDKNE